MAGNAVLVLKWKEIALWVVRNARRRAGLCLLLGGHEPCNDPQRAEASRSEMTASENQVHVAKDQRKHYALHTSLVPLIPRAQNDP